MRGALRVAGLALVLGGALPLAQCGPPNPCAASSMRLATRYAQPYFGRWKVVRGDTLTLPQMGDRFRLTAVILDTARIASRTGCRFTGAITFAVPRAETLAVTWIAQLDQAFIYGWPADLGPFAGLSLTWAGRDSLSGAILLDSKLGVQARPGMTARFVAGRSQRLSSVP